MSDPNVQRCQGRRTWLVLALLLALAPERYDGSDPANLGSGNDITFKELVCTSARLTGFDGRIVWDPSKPDGQPKRRLDVSRAEQHFGFPAKTSFEDGPRRTIEWYLENQVEVEARADQVSPSASSGRSLRVHE